MEIDFFFVMVIELTWSQCGGSNLKLFCCRDEIDLVPV